MLFIEVPPYRDPSICHPAKVNFYVINGKRKRSQPQHFTYTPLPGTYVAIRRIIWYCTFKIYVSVRFSLHIVYWVLFIFSMICALWILHHRYSLILLPQFRLLRPSRWMNMNLVGWVIPCRKCWGCLPSHTITLGGSSTQTVAWCLASSPVSRPAWVSPLRTTDFSSRAKPYCTPVLEKACQAVLFTLRREPLWCQTPIVQFWSTRVPQPSPLTWVANIPPTSIPQLSSSHPPTTTCSEEEIPLRHHPQNISTSFIVRAITSIVPKLQGQTVHQYQPRHPSTLRITPLSSNSSPSSREWPKTGHLLSQ